jgi:exonuclease SbcC
MRVKSLKLKNFQAHSSTQIDFSPYITTLQGKSDVGKSSVARALRWALLNDFAGEDFIQAGKKETEVTATLFMGSGKDLLNLSRRKGRLASKNEYDLEGSIFKSFGTGVPESIQQVVQVNDINFQGQHDSPFWFSLTAGEVSRRLNSVIDLSIIDQSLSNIAQAARKAATAEQVCQERLKDAQDKLKEMEGAEQRVTDYKALRKARKESEDAKTNCDILEEVVQRLRANNNEDLKVRWQDTHEVFHTLISYGIAEKKAGTLKSLIESIALARDWMKEPPSFAPLEKNR